MALKMAVAWPGAGPIESFAYSCSHGISPGAAVLVTRPRSFADTQPRVFGDLVWGDGQRAVRLRDCKLDSLTPRRDGRGLSWTLSIFDRRWRWRTPGASFGQVSGYYNELDPRAKLTPFSIRSPRELAVLCLKAMGEARYEIDLPDGLSTLDGNGLQRYFQLGENVRQSRANPAVNWDYTPPAEALARLVELFGRRVVFCPVTNKVIIAPLGEGAGLPAGPCSMIGSTIDLPEKPSSVCVRGARTLYQCRLPLEPVAEEWDGSFVPIDEVSYRPASATDPGSKHVIVYRFTESSVETGDVRVRLNLNLFRDYGYTVVRTVTTAAPGDTVLDNMAAAAALVNADPDAAALLVASVEVNPDNGRAELLTFTARQEGVTWGSAQVTRPEDDSSPWAVTFTAPRPSSSQGGWEDAGVPTFSSVRGTDRLSPQQARELAQRSVWKCFRVRLVDVATLQGALKIPGYDGPILRRMQIVLQTEKVDQVVPAPRRAGGRTRGNTGGAGGIIPAFYNGYSRGAAPDVYGSIAQNIGSVLWEAGNDDNTDPGSKVYVSFNVVPEQQMIVFADHVYAREAVTNTSSRYRRPALVLETAVTLRDATTNAPVRAEFKRPLGGEGGEEWSPREDVQVAYKAVYGDGHKLEDVFKDDSDAKPRADYYLDAMQARHTLKGGETRQYVGTFPIDPNGLIQQVSWSVGAGGATTTASTNTEHDDYVIPYPDRRRAENLPPHAQAKNANLLEQLERDTGLPTVTDAAVRFWRGIR